MIPPKWRLLMPVFAVLFIPAPIHATDDGMRCVQCGMDLNKYPHSLYVIQWKDGTVVKTCGVQCGLTQHLMHPDGFKSSTATDLITNREFPAAEGFYVFKSSVTTDMGPGFIAFKERTNAEKFQKGFGGEVMTYPEALEIWAEIKKVGR
jgi:nitrous oxide reductase accessory protein NosL